MKRAGVLAMALLAMGCSQGVAPAKQVDHSAGAQLEAAAIAAGVVSDPNRADIAGLYARDTDRACIVPGPGGDYRIGILVDYDERQGCSGSGAAKRDGDAVSAVFDGAPGCSFDMRFDGDQIVFPGHVPDACAKLCSGRASLAAFDVERLSESVSEAATLRNGHGKLLCDTQAAP